MGGVWGEVTPPKSWDTIESLSSTIHNDSIPETPSGKSGGGRVHPSSTVTTSLLLEGELALSI